MDIETFDWGNILLNRIAKLEHFRAKIDREFPEFGYDLEAKELIGNDIYSIIDNKIGWLKKEFEEL